MVGDARVHKRDPFEVAASPLTDVLPGQVESGDADDGDAFAAAVRVDPASPDLGPLTVGEVGLDDVLVADVERPAPGAGGGFGAAAADQLGGGAEFGDVVHGAIPSSHS
ncbi:hypothetical protein BJF79_13685 [Actinomadura sp. CNU-125]|nr:hypothetical protein BJF79_13685 [Actinomadura sp. CNU-125]